MKPEPLKDKKVSLGLYLDSVVNPLKQNVYIEKDLKSAVEWLKEELARDKGNTPTDEIIDKAFEDVIKK